MLEIFNYLGEIFNRPTGEESASRGEGLKILTPNQVLGRLPISLAQLKAGNNSEKLKNEIRQSCILCTGQKNLQNNSIKVWSTLFKTWKQSLWTLKTEKQVNHTDLNWICQIKVISKTQIKTWL